MRACFETLKMFHGSFSIRQNMLIAMEKSAKANISPVVVLPKKVILQ